MTFAYIFAREGSKGLPGKNIKELCGLPLIAWSINCAKKVHEIKEIIVSTDSEEIAEISRYYGASVPFMRPKDLAQDHSPEWLSWQHALKCTKEVYGAMPEKMISLPATAPLREVDDVVAVIKKINTNDFDSIITVTQAHRNPYFNMVREKSDGSVGVVINHEGVIFRRQDAPKVYDITTVAYAANAEFVMSHNHLFEGKVGSVEVPVSRSIDIDTHYDFEIASFLMRKNL